MLPCIELIKIPLVHFSSRGLLFDTCVYGLIDYHMKKYTPKLASEIKALLDLGVPKAVVARKYGISRQCVYDWMEKLEKQMQIGS